MTPSQNLTRRPPLRDFLSQVATPRTPALSRSAISTIRYNRLISTSACSYSPQEKQERISQTVPSFPRPAKIPQTQPERQGDGAASSHSSIDVSSISPAVGNKGRTSRRSRRKKPVPPPEVESDENLSVDPNSMYVPQELIHKLMDEKEYEKILDEPLEGITVQETDEKGKPIQPEDEGKSNFKTLREAEAYHTELRDKINEINEELRRRGVNVADDDVDDMLEELGWDIPGKDFDQAKAWREMDLGIHPEFDGANSRQPLHDKVAEAFDREVAQMSSDEFENFANLAGSLGMDRKLFYKAARSAGRSEADAPSENIRPGNKMTAPTGMPSPENEDSVQFFKAMAENPEIMAKLMREMPEDGEVLDYSKMDEEDMASWKQTEKDFDMILEKMQQDPEGLQRWFDEIESGKMPEELRLEDDQEEADEEESDYSPEMLEDMKRQIDPETAAELRKRGIDPDGPPNLTLDDVPKDVAAFMGLKPKRHLQQSLAQLKKLTQDIDMEDIADSLQENFEPFFKSKKTASFKKEKAANAMSTTAHEVQSQAPEDETSEIISVASKKALKDTNTALEEYSEATQASNEKSHEPKIAVNPEIAPTTKQVFTSNSRREVVADELSASKKDILENNLPGLNTKKNSLSSNSKNTPSSTEEQQPSAPICSDSSIVSPTASEIPASTIYQQSFHQPRLQASVILDKIPETSTKVAKENEAFPTLEEAMEEASSKMEKLHNDPELAELKKMIKEVKDAEETESIPALEELLKETTSNIDKLPRDLELTELKEMMRKVKDLSGLNTSVQNMDTEEEEKSQLEHKRAQMEAEIDRDDERLSREQELLERLESVLQRPGGVDDTTLNEMAKFIAQLEGDETSGQQSGDSDEQHEGVRASAENIEQKVEQALHDLKDFMSREDSPLTPETKEMIMKEVSQGEKLLGQIKDMPRDGASQSSQMPQHEMNQMFLQNICISPHPGAHDHEKATIRQLNVAMVNAAEKLGKGQAIPEDAVRNMWSMLNKVVAPKRTLGVSPSQVPKLTWDFLWTVFDNEMLPGRWHYIYHLGKLMAKANMTLLPGQQLLVIAAMFETGHQDAAINNWKRARSTLGQDPNTAFSYYELGISMFCLSKDLKRAEVVVGEALNLEHAINPRLVMPFIDTCAKTPDWKEKAWLYYRDLRDRLANTMVIQDYDIIIGSFLAGNEVEYGLYAFVDMMSGGAVDMTRHTKLPKTYANKFFVGKWLKRLIGARDLDGAAKVVHMMMEKGVTPAPMQLNGLIGACFRSGDSNKLAMGEHFALRMIRSRIDFVATRGRRIEPQLEGPIRAQLASPQHDRWPRASSETFALLAEFYRASVSFSKLAELWEVLKAAEIEVDGFLLAPLLQHYLKTGQGDAGLEFFFQSVNRLRPHLRWDTFKPLWLSLIVNRANTDIPHVGPLAQDQKIARRLFREMMMSDKYLRIDKMRAPEVLSRTILGTFQKLQDWPGMLVAFRTLVGWFGLVVTDELALQVLTGDWRSARNLRSSRPARSQQAAHKLARFLAHRLKASGRDPKTLSAEERSNEITLYIDRVISSQMPKVDSDNEANSKQLKKAFDDMAVKFDSKALKRHATMQNQLAQSALEAHALDTTISERSAWVDKAKPILVESKLPLRGTRNNKLGYIEAMKQGVMPGAKKAFSTWFNSQMLERGILGKYLKQ